LLPTTCRVELALAGAVGHAELLGDFPVGEALHVVEHQHGAEPGREQRDGPLQIDATTRLGLRGGPLPLPAHCGDASAVPARQLPEPVEDDAHQPGPERGPPIELVQGARRLEPAVLQDVVRFRRIAGGQPEGEPVEGGSVPAVERFEGRLVAVRDHPVGQVPIGQSIRHSSRHPPWAAADRARPHKVSGRLARDGWEDAR
jgi:hypothetical protein